MCNDYEQHVAWTDYRKAMQQLELGIPTEQAEADLQQGDDIRVNEISPVMRVADNGVELVPMTFGFPPKRPRPRSCVHFKSEGRRFDQSNRCLIPASAFFEFTGKRYPKAKHRFALNGAPLMAIAGLWREAEGDGSPSFTMLTTAPSADVEPYHDRQVLVLPPTDWAAWLHMSKPEAELLRPSPEGSLEVTTVRKGSE